MVDILGWSSRCSCLTYTDLLDADVAAWKQPLLKLSYDSRNLLGGVERVGKGQVVVLGAVPHTPSHCTPKSHCVCFKDI